MNKETYSLNSVSTYLSSSHKSTISPLSGNTRSAIAKAQDPDNPWRIPYTDVQRLGPIDNNSVNRNKTKHNINMQIYIARYMWDVFRGIIRHRALFFS